MDKKKILFIASEAQPFVASGGLGEVIGSLPKALAEDNSLDVRVVMPLYSVIPDKFRSEFRYVGHFYVDLAWRKKYCGVFEYKHCGVTFYFLDNEQYYKRNGIYGYLDEAERFAFFSKASLDFLNVVNFIPQVVHCHDWQSALVPVYLKTLYKDVDMYKNIRTVFTIHNMEYQGKYSLDLLYDLFDLPEWARSLVEYEDDINLMKGAIQCSDIVSTVSPSYAGEILEPDASCGLFHINRQNSYKMRGILNGIDAVSYCSGTDGAIFKNFDIDSLDQKVENKLGLQKMLGLPERGDVPMLSMITRLVSHKGLDLVTRVIDELLYTTDVQFVMLGTGDFAFEDFFRGLENRHPDKVRALIEFNGALSRKIYAGSDMFLMPSKTEPCGLSQMICTRYATVPIVRKVGGLGDSIVDNGNGDGIGFTFFEYNAHHMLDTIKRAISTYENKKDWTALMKRAMKEDFTWAKSAKDYVKMYMELL